MTAFFSLRRAALPRLFTATAAAAVGVISVYSTKSLARCAAPPSYDAPPSYAEATEVHKPSAPPLGSKTPGKAPAPTAPDWTRLDEQAKKMVAKHANEARTKLQKDAILHARAEIARVAN